MPINCIYCSKECKTTDSKPFPNSKGTERIHHKCQIKKNLSDKSGNKPASKSISSASSNSIFDRLMIEDKECKLIAQVKNKPTEKTTQKSHFFDLEAGVAKPHEKRQYLHHRNISEIATRFNDEGHQEDTGGAVFDHTGSTALDEDNNKTLKRKHEDDFKVERARSRIKIDQSNPCWFCLSSPKVEKHLIVAIGEHCYLTLAKGGLTDEHMLILPIEHIESLNHTKANSKELLDELEQFKSSLIQYFKSKNQEALFFERNFKSVHWQLQVVPINLQILPSIEDEIKSISKLYFKNCDYVDIPKDLSLSDMIQPGSPYLSWQIGFTGPRFVTRIETKGAHFPIQLARLVLSHERILNCPDRADWKDCTKSEEEYNCLVKEIKENFKNYDFT